MDRLSTLTRLDREVLDYIVEAVRVEQTVSAIEVEEAILDAFGIQVRLRTSGREMGVVQLDYAHLGVPEDSARRKKLRAPRMEMMPKDTMDAVAAIFARTRHMIERTGVNLAHRKTIWVPMQRWSYLEQEVIRLRREVEAIIEQDILKRYENILEENLLSAEAKAGEAYNALVDAGVMPEDDRDVFINRFVRFIKKEFPNYEDIASGVSLNLETSRPAPSYLVSVVVAAKNRYFRLREEGVEEKRMRKKCAGMSDCCGNRRFSLPFSMR